MYVIKSICFDECFLFHVISGRNLASATGLVQPPCYCVLEIKKSILKGSTHFISIISTITCQCYQYQRSKINLLLFKFSQKIVSVDSDSFTFFHLVNVSLFPQKMEFLNLPGGIFFIKSYNYIFMTRYLFL